MLTVYAYRNCSSCRNALRWLDEHGISHQVKAIRESPPTLTELKTALASNQGEIRKLFNTSGMDYRALGLKDRLPDMTDEEALTLLTQNGNLVKRPFAVGEGVTLNGFKHALWEQALL